MVGLEDALMNAMVDALVSAFLDELMVKRMNKQFIWIDVRNTSN